MFRRLAEPLPLSEASLLVLRPALNAPVLNVEFLPVGPARAALVVFAEEYGGIGVAFGIRSVEGGQVAVLRNQEPVDEAAPLMETLEPALAEAERMGFLFDEDMLAGSDSGGRSEALALWGQLMGDFEASASESPAIDEHDSGVASEGQDRPAKGAADVTEVEEVDELVLEEVAPLDISDFDDEIDEIELDLEASSRSIPDLSVPTLPMRKTAAPTKPAPKRAPEPVAPPKTRAPTLSKFRHVDVESGESPSRRIGPDSESDGPASELGRIALKKVRTGREGAKRLSFVARLLTSF